MKHQFNKPVNNRGIVEHVPDFWIEQVQYNEGLKPSFTTYQQVDNDAHETLLQQIHLQKCQRLLKITLSILSRELKLMFL